MKCEEFEAIGLGLDRESTAQSDLRPESGGEVRRDLKGIDPLEYAAAIEHANNCARCAALQESWYDAQIELRSLREATRNVSAPPRVEMRLRQEFWAKRRAVRVRRFALTSAWALASAVLLIVGMSWWNWHIAQEDIPLQSLNIPVGGPGKTNSKATASPAAVSNGEAAEDSQSVSPADATLVAANDAEQFTLLPGSLSQETGDGAVVRVRLQRGALGALGLPVNEERAGEWIQVDLLVGQDGQPQAVRLPR
jgi:hypothetical protein